MVTSTTPYLNTANPKGQTAVHSFRDPYSPNLLLHLPLFQDHFLFPSEVDIDTHIADEVGAEVVVHGAHASVFHAEVTRHCPV